MLILDAIRSRAAELRPLLCEAGMFDPATPLDAARTRFARDVLGRMLPDRYAARVGVAFSADDAEAEPSVLVVDATYAYPLGHLIPCESVYAACELAPVLDRDAFQAALQRIARFKSLSRESASERDVTPFLHLGVFGARYAQFSEERLNPHLAYVFAGRGDDPAVLLEDLNAALFYKAVTAERTPDVVFCLCDGWLITRQTHAGEIALPKSSFGKFGIVRAGANTLALMWLLLNAHLAQIQLRAPSLLRALGQVSRESRGNGPA